MRCLIETEFELNEKVFLTHGFYMKKLTNNAKNERLYSSLTALILDTSLVAAISINGKTNTQLARKIRKQ